MKNILLIKLSDGHELVGELVKDTATHVTIHKPLQINYRYFMSSVPHVSFARFMMFTLEQTIVLDTRHVLTMSIPRKTFVDYYLDNVDDFFGKIQQTIDEELIAVLSSSQKDLQMKKILELLPTDKVMN